MSQGNQRPKRDASARAAIGECDYCGGDASAALGGEHIFKCSEVILKDELEELVDDWGQKDNLTGDGDGVYQECANELEDLIADG